MQDHGNFTPEVQKEALQSITFKAFCSFANSFFSRLWLEFLVIGNLTKNDALDIVGVAETGFAALRPKLELIAIPQIPEIRVVDVPLNTTWVFQKSLPFTEQFQQKNSSCDKTFFLGSTFNDLRTKLLLQILNQYISEPAFQVLRTQQQLGYIVAMY